MRDASRTERVFSGETIPRNPDASFDDPENAGIWAAIREIDLNGDGVCDLVVTAFEWAGTAGNLHGHAVFWFADAKGWRRQGPDRGTRSAGLHPMSRALLGPDTKEGFFVHGFGNYAPVKLPDGRIALVVHVDPRVDASTVAPVLAWDARTRAIAPLAVDAAPLVAAVTNFCMDQQAGGACATW